MDGDDMLAFALRWLPFGGGDPEDIWIAFGLSERVYFHRLQMLLDGEPPPGIDDSTWLRMKRSCSERLIASTRPPATDLHQP